LRASHPELPLELKKTTWRKFLSQSVGASSIGEYWYCPAKIANARTFGEAETTETVKGSEYHEIEAKTIIEKLGPLKKVKVESVFDIMKLSRDNIEAALMNREILANSEEDVLFWSVLPEARYIGVPDKADCTNAEEPILMDFKTTARLPGDAWVDHRIQLGAYMLGIERLGFGQSYGIVRYVSRLDSTLTTDFKVYLDGYLRDEVLATAQEVHKIFLGGKPRPTSNPNKCKACPYRKVCEWSLARDN